MKTKYILLAGLILLPALAFFLYFRNDVALDKSSGWADLATYMSVFVSLANLAVFIILTEKLHSYNQQRDDFLSKADKPIIIFKLKTKNSNYLAENVGRGAALNVIIKGDLDIPNKCWKEVYHYYSFSANMEKDVCVKNNNALLALYEDIYGNEYVSYMDWDKLRYFEIKTENKKREKSEEPEELKISKYKSVSPTWPT